MSIVPFARPASKPKAADPVGYAAPPSTFAGHLAAIEAQGQHAVTAFLAGDESVAGLAEMIEDAYQVGWTVTTITPAASGETDGLAIGLEVSARVIDGGKAHDPAEATRAWQAKQTEKSAAASECHDEAARVSGIGDGGAS